MPDGCSLAFEKWKPSFFVFFFTSMQFSQVPKFDCEGSSKLIIKLNWTGSELNLSDDTFCKRFGSHLTTPKKRSSIKALSFFQTFLVRQWKHEEFDRGGSMDDTGSGRDTSSAKSELNRGSSSKLLTERLPVFWPTKLPKELPAASSLHCHSIIINIAIW